MIEIYKEIAA